MRRILSLLTLFIAVQTHAQVKIGGPAGAPASSAVLELSSNRLGFLPPRMTQAERGGILSPVVGLIIYQTDNNPGLYEYNGTTWVPLRSIPSGTTAGQTLLWNGTQWVTLNPGAQGQVLTSCDGSLTFTTNGVCPGSITAINCASSTSTGFLTSGVIASGVSSSIPYTGGNGGPHQGQTVTSTGVTGLTATLAPGSFATGAGSLTYTITGTPSAAGNANFAINIGGRTCTLTRNVEAPSPYPAGTVHCITGGAAVVEVTNPLTGRTWMDRNLGASRVATNSLDGDAFGDLYQWGRFSDGHQCRNSPATSTLSNSNQAPNSAFILIATTPFDWRSPQNDALWQGVNGTNNPCPTGFRIPTQAEWDAERVTWSSQNSAGAFASPLKLVNSGRRFNNSGSVENSGIRGVYWTSTINLTQANVMMFDSFSAGAVNNSRAVGNAVRCIKN